MTADIDHRGIRARLTTDHAAAIQGIPVLMVGGVAHGTADPLTCAGRVMLAREFVREWLLGQARAHNTRLALGQAFLDAPGSRASGPVAALRAATRPGAGS